MKTLNFTKQYLYGADEADFCYMDAFYDQFIISNLDVRIKEVTPFFSYAVTSFDASSGQLDVSGNGYFNLSSIYGGRLSDSPVKCTYGSLSTSAICFPINQRSVVDLRVFAGDELGIVLPFFITGKGAPVNLFQLTVYVGVNILYEEVERKTSI